jgi:hypothetical protein
VVRTRSEQAENTTKIRASRPQLSDAGR